MIREAHGNLITADAEALVNTVNTAGVMGKGIALQFKQAFPANYKAYRRACDRGEVQLGRMFVFDNGTPDLGAGPRYIVNFPTKKHWKSKSRLEDIATGLDDLIRVLREYHIKSVAIPPLGCGNGGLDWRDVQPMIMDMLGQVPDVEVSVYPPEGAPIAQSMPVRTERPKMTPGRAVLLGILRRYKPTDIGVSRLEIQKLMYLLQVRGEPLKLTFSRQKFGPYAENLQHVLQAMEGHYLTGYGDRTTAPPIELVPGAGAEAEAFLDTRPATLARIDEVAGLVDGFESPYGLELLATVHWMTTERPETADNLELLIDEVQAWSARKKRLFTTRHIAIAFQHLRDAGWIGPEPAAQAS